MTDGNNRIFSSTLPKDTFNIHLWAPQYKPTWLNYLRFGNKHQV